MTDDDEYSRFRQQILLEIRKEIIRKRRQENLSAVISVAIFIITLILIAVSAGAR